MTKALPDIPNRKIKILVFKFLLYLAIEETLKRGSGWHFWGTLFFRKMNHLPDILNRVILIVWIAIQTYIGLWNKCLLLKWNTGLLRHFAVLDFGGSDYFVRIKRHYSFTNFRPLLTKFNAVLPRTCLLYAAHQPKFAPRNDGIGGWLTGFSSFRRIA